MNKIRVCIVSLYAYHMFNPKVYSRFGGAEMQLYNLATELAKDERFEVIFLVGDFGQPEIESIQGVQLRKFYNPNGGLKYIRAFIAMFRLWRVLGKIKATIYLQRAAGLETGVVALFCKFRRKKFVYMAAHDQDTGITRPSWMKGFIGSLRWNLYKLGVTYADTVIVQHQGQQAAVKKNYHKESIIRNSAHHIPDELDTSQKHTILWVARADDWKQPEIFLHLAQKFPSEKFVMIMPESNDKLFFQKIKEQAAKLHNLNFLGFVPVNEIDKFFQQAKIFINTSKTEGYPNTFIQAAKSKVPIISLNVDPNGTLEKCEMGLCAQGDPSELESDLGYLLSNQELIDKMGEHGFQFAKKYHDISKIIEEDKKLFIKLATNDGKFYLS